MVDMGVGNDNLLYGEAVALQNGQHLFDVVSGIDNHGFARIFIAYDGAVALQWANGNDLVNHGLNLPRTGWQRERAGSDLCREIVCGKVSHPLIRVVSILRSTYGSSPWTASCS